jgi:hypothetical protein
MAYLFVLVFLDTLELHRVVDLNALSAQNVLRTKHALVKNVLIHVQERVDTMLDVKLSIIVQSAVALLDKLEIHSEVALMHQKLLK